MFKIYILVRHLLATGEFYLLTNTLGELLQTPFKAKHIHVYKLPSMRRLFVTPRKDAEKAFTVSLINQCLREYNIEHVKVITNPKLFGVVTFADEIEGINCYTRQKRNEKIFVRPYNEREPSNYLDASALKVDNIVDAAAVDTVIQEVTKFVTLFIEANLGDVGFVPVPTFDTIFVHRNETEHDMPILVLVFRDAKFKIFALILKNAIQNLEYQFKGKFYHLVCTLFDPTSANQKLEQTKQKKHDDNKRPRHEAFPTEQPKEVPPLKKKRYFE